MASGKGACLILALRIGLRENDPEKCPMCKFLDDLEKKIALRKYDKVLKNYHITKQHGLGEP